MRGAGKKLKIQEENGGTESKDGSYNSGVGLDHLWDLWLPGKLHNSLGSHPYFVDEELVVPAFSLYITSI